MTSRKYQNRLSTETQNHLEKFWKQSEILLSVEGYITFNIVFVGT